MNADYELSTILLWYNCETLKRMSFVTMREKEGLLIHHSDETGATLSEYSQILNQFFVITV